MMGSHCIVVLCTILLSAANAELLGKLVFHGNDQQDHSNQKSFLNVLHKPDAVKFSPNPGPIPSNEVASVLSLALGLSVPKDITWAGLQVSNPFDLPKAVVMLSIDGLPKGSKLKMAATESFPVNLVDGVASVSDMYYVSSKYSLASHIGAIFEGRSTIRSVSGDDQTASSGHSNTASSETSVWSEATESWKVVGGDGEVKTTMSKHQVTKRISDILVSGFKYNEEKQTVTVNKEGLEFSFNLDDRVDFKLFSELVYIAWQFEEMKKNKHAVRDSAPDLYLLSVSALKGLEKKYGADAKQVQGALLLIEKFTAKLVKDFTKLYDGNILIVGLAVSSGVGVLDAHKDKLEPMLKVLQDNKVMLVNFDNTSPEIHIADQMEAAARQKLCLALQQSLSKTNDLINLKCSHELPVHVMHRRSLLAVSDASAAATAARNNLNLSSDYDETFPVIFNMWFWLVVLLALICYATSVAMWNMDPGRDSIIYRLTQQKIKSE